MSEDSLGADGQLVENLMSALRTLAGEDKAWFTAAAANIAVGLGTGFPRGGGINDAFFDILQERLDELLTAGIGEEFIIFSIRDTVTRFYNRLGNGHVQANDDRQKTRREIEALLSDPFALQTHAEAHPDSPFTAGKSLDEAREELRGFLDGPFFQEIGPDDVARDWRSADVWRRCIAENELSDEAIDHWRQHNLDRRFRHP